MAPASCRKTLKTPYHCRKRAASCVPFTPNSRAGRTDGIPRGSLSWAPTAHLLSFAKPPPPLQRHLHQPSRCPSHCTEDEDPRWRRRSCVGPAPHLALWEEGLIHWPWSIQLQVRKAEKAAPRGAFWPHPESRRWGCRPQVTDMKRTFLSPWCRVPPTTTFLDLIISPPGMCGPLQLLARMGAQPWRR